MFFLFSWDMLVPWVGNPFSYSQLNALRPALLAITLPLMQRGDGGLGASQMCESR